MYYYRKYFDTPSCPSILITLSLSLSFRIPISLHLPTWKSERGLQTAERTSFCRAIKTRWQKYQRATVETASIIANVNTPIVDPRSRCVCVFFFPSPWCLSVRLSGSRVGSAMKPDRSYHCCETFPPDQYFPSWSVSFSVSRRIVHSPVVQNKIMITRMR